MPSPRFPIPQGTLDMLILQILSLEPAHGYGIAQRLEQISQSVVQVNQGSLYPALHRLEQKQWLKAEWKQSETGREAKFYSLTSAGRKQLAVEKKQLGAADGSGPVDFRRGKRVMRRLLNWFRRGKLESGLGPRIGVSHRPPGQRPGGVRSAGAGSAEASQRWNSAASRRSRRKCATSG